MATLLDDTEPIEAAHGADDSRKVCEECGARVRDLWGHKRKVHKSPPLPRGRPPKQDSQPAAPRARTTTARKARSLRADLEVTYGLMAEFWRMRDPVCGQVAFDQVPKIAMAWDTAAQNNRRLHEALEKLMGGAGLAGVALAHAPIVMIVFAHHGPQKEQYFPSQPPPMAEEPTVEAPVMNGDGAWPQGGPVTGEYAPASADRAR